MQLIKVTTCCLLLFLFFFFPATDLTARQTNSLSLEGRVVSEANGESLTGVTLVLFNADSTWTRATSTDQNGHFEIRDIRSGTYTLLARYIGFRSYRESIELTQSLNNFEIKLLPERMRFNDLEVRAGSIQDSSSVTTSIQRISSTSVQQLAGGQGNVFNMLKVTPSVTSTSDYSSQLIVRGGEANQNLFYIDDIEIYSPYQASGAGSIFNPNIIRTLDFYSGAFPARYGDRLSSVLVINTTTGEPTAPFHADLNVDATTASATLNGTLPFMDGSWLVSGRKTYFDSFANTFAQAALTKNDIAFPDFYDLTAKIQLRPADFHSISILGLYSREVIDWISQEDQFGELESSRSDFVGEQKSMNRAAGITWSFSPSSVFQSKVYANWYRNIGDNGLGGVFRPGVVPKDEPGPGEWVSPVEPGDRIEIDYDQSYQFDKYSTGATFFLQLPRNSIELGAGADYLDNYLDIDLGLNEYTSVVFSNFENTTGILEAVADTIQSQRNNTRYNAYLQNRVEVIPGRLFIQPGVRYSYYDINDEHFLLPRAGLSFIPANGLTIRAGFGKYVQSPGFEKLIEPDNMFNISKFRDVASLKAETSTQYVLGLTKTLQEQWSFSIEGYYKTYDNLITNEYIQEERLVDVFRATTHERITTLDPNNYYFELRDVYRISDIPVNNGTGTSKGLEFMVQKFSKPEGPWSGWASYVLAKSERTETVEGERITYPFDYDRRHTFNLVLSRRLTENWDTGISWRFGSGLPYTEPIALEPMTYTYDDNGYFIADFETELIQMNPDFGGVDNINQKRYDPYNRIDLRVRYRNQFNNVNYALFLDLINVFNNQNIQSYKYVMYIDDPNPEGTPAFLRKPSGARLKKEPVFMYPFIPSFGINLEF